MLYIRLFVLVMIALCTKSLQFQAVTQFVVAKLQWLVHPLTSQ